MANSLVKDSYNKVAETYSANRDQFKNDKYLDLLIEKLDPNSKILDIGCGAGLPIDKYLADQGFIVQGIDISEKQIELAKKNVPQAQYDVKDMSDLKQNEYQADAVVSFYAIFHIPREHHKELFGKIYSFLPIGGLILVSMGAEEWVGKEDFYGEPMNWSHYDAEKNISIVQDTGFDILHSEIDTSGDEKHLIILGQKK